MKDLNVKTHIIEIYPTLCPTCKKPLYKFLKKYGGKYDKLIFKYDAFYCPECGRK